MKHKGNFFAKWNLSKVADHVILFIFLELMLRNSWEMEGEEWNWCQQINTGKETYRMGAPFSIVCEFHPLVCGGIHLLALVILNL